MLNWETAYTVVMAILRASQFGVMESCQVLWCDMMIWDHSSCNCVLHRMGYNFIWDGKSPHPLPTNVTVTSPSAPTATVSATVNCSIPPVLAGWYTRESELIKWTSCTKVFFPSLNERYKYKCYCTILPRIDTVATNHVSFVWYKKFIIQV